MRTLDKYILRGLVVNYVIALGVMISLYVVLDLFFNMDEFTEGSGGVRQLLWDVFSFYGNRIFLYFAQLSGVITLFACLITLARMRKTNELTTMLSSGISLYRAAAPVVAFGIFTSALWYVDTEYVIPSIAHKLARRHDDARGVRTYEICFLPDRDGRLLSARQYLPDEQVLKRVLVMKRTPEGAIESAIEAEQARWEPTPGGPTKGIWRLERGFERRRTTAGQGEGTGLQGDIERPLVSAYASDLDPNTIEMRQSTGWISFLSSNRLTELSKELDGTSLRHVRQAKHVRFTTPLVNVLMLLLGLPFVLDRNPANILAAGGKSLMVCGACFLMTFVTQNLDAVGGLSSLPAWLPVIVFTPIAVILFDRVRT